MYSTYDPMYHIHVQNELRFYKVQNDNTIAIRIKGMTKRENALLELPPCPLRMWMHRK